MKDYASVSTVTTADGETTVLSGDGTFHGVVITTDGTNDVTVLIEDGTTEMFTFKVAGENNGDSCSLPCPVKFTTRLDVTVTGTGGQANIMYGD